MKVAALLVLAFMFAISASSMEDDETKEEPCRPYSYPMMQYASDSWRRVVGQKIGEGQPYLPSALNDLIADYAFSPAMISAGLNSSFFVLDGQLWTCGENVYGQLGDGTTISRSNLEITPLDGYVTQIASYYHRTAALTDQGFLYGWGRDYTIVAGHRDDGQHLKPARLDTEHSIAQTALGQSNSFMLTRDGQVFGWSTIRDFKSEEAALVPIEGERVVQIAANLWQALALTETGKIFQWQANFHKPPYKFEPKEVAVKWRVIQIAAGGHFFLALTEDGQVFRWSVDTNNESKFNPIQAHIPIDGKVEQIAAFSYFGLALTNQGEVWAWGSNSYGQLGSDIPRDHGWLTPVRVQLKRHFVQIAAGCDHSLALAYNDETCSWELWGWGKNDEGQLGIDDKSNILRPIMIQIPGITPSTAPARE